MFSLRKGESWTSPTPPATRRHDGWTPARKAQFLEALAQDGNVRAACARVGMSREAAYRLRRREALFARAWAAAQCRRANSRRGARHRAIEGIEEEVWYRGEVVGTRRRYDTRLLLAHMARLDKLAEDEARARTPPGSTSCSPASPGTDPRELAVDEGELPLDRATCAQMMAELAARSEARDDECREAYRRGHAEGEALWDAWFAGACDTRRPAARPSRSRRTRARSVDTVKCVNFGPCERAAGAQSHGPAAVDPPCREAGRGTAPRSGVVEGHGAHPPRHSASCAATSP